jgi:DNA-binding CsgD family transcriptional regulator
VSKTRTDGKGTITLLPSSTNGEEVIVGGRRYRLIPVDRDLVDEPPAKPSPADLLTERELQIAALVAAGRVNKQIAAELRISEWTVSTHLRRIFAKLGVDTRAAMVRKCIDVLPRIHAG